MNTRLAQVPAVARYALAALLVGCAGDSVTAPRGPQIPTAVEGAVGIADWDMSILNLNPAQPIAGLSFQVSVQVVTSNDNDWHQTRIQLARDGYGSNPIFNSCFNHSDHDGTGTYSETFNIPASGSGWDFGQFLVNGGYTIIVTGYRADGSCNSGDEFGSGPAHASFTIGGIATATTVGVAFGINPMAPGQQVTYSASVKNVNTDALITTDSIEFRMGGTSCLNGTVLGTALTTSGHADFTPDAAQALAITNGTTIRACYPGSSTYATSSDELTQYVLSVTKQAIDQNPAGNGNSEPDVYTGVPAEFIITVTSPAGAPPLTGVLVIWDRIPSELSNDGATAPTFENVTGTWTCPLTQTAIGGGTTASIQCRTPDGLVAGASLAIKIKAIATAAGASVVNRVITGVGVNPPLPPTDVCDVRVICESVDVIPSPNAPTEITVSGLPDPSKHGQSVTITADVRLAGSTTPVTAGHVEFRIGSTSCSDGTPLPLAPFPLNGLGQASTTRSFTFSEDNSSIRACYLGTPGFAASDGEYIQDVDKSPTLTTADDDIETSTVGQQVVFTVTVGASGGGVGTPTGIVTLYKLNGGTCTAPGAGSLTLGSGLLAAGVATINVTALPAGVHTVRACYPGDADFEASSGTDNHTVNAEPTTVVASVETASPQYSDKATLRATITPLTASGSTQTGTVHFYVNGGVSCGTSAPAGAVGSDPIDASGVAEIDYQVLSAAGAYTLTACFYSGNTNFTNGSDTESITITTEDATITPDASNINAIAVGSGGVSPAFTLKFLVRETNTEPDANAGAMPGEIWSPTTFTAQLKGVGSGGNLSGNCTLLGTDPAPLVRSYSETKTYSCDWSGVPIDAYEVVATIHGSFYDGTDSDVLTVYDPNAGFVTGGGKFTFPGSADRVNFGLVFTNPSKKSLRGNLLVIRHMANGDICRTKSNGLEAPAIVQNTASLAGKGNFSCTRPDGTHYDGAGNLTITGWVQDNGHGANASVPDRFWVKVLGAPNNNQSLVMPGTGPANAAPLTGGNIQVPQPGR